MPTSSSKRSKELGLTLLEVLVALTIIAGLLSLTLPRMRSSDKTKSLIRKITVLTKSVHSTARLKGLPYRIVIEMGNESTHRLYVERGNSANASIKESEEIKSNQDNAEATPVPEFVVDEKVLKNPLELPGDFKFDEIEFGSKEDKVTSGRAFIYFFPQGFATKAAIHISSGETKKFTIVIHPLTGQSYATQGYVSLKDIE